MHQAFLKILENFDKVGEISCHKTRSYVVIIVRNAAINMYNRRKRHPAVPIEEAAFCAAGEKLERTDDLDSLAKAVLKLPAIYKDALKLKYVQEFSNAEIAGMLGISETAVRKRLERAKRMLEEILRREDFCDDRLILQTTCSGKPSSGLTSANWKPCRRIMRLSMNSQKGLSGR